MIIVLIVGGTLALVLGIPKIRTYLSLGHTSLCKVIDRSLGQFTVKRHEADEGVDKLLQIVRDLLEGQIKCQVQSELLADRLQVLEGKKHRTESSLSKLWDLISRKEPAVLAGGEYSVSQLQTLAEEVIRTHDSLMTQMTGIGKAKQILEKNAASLENRARLAKGRITTMQSQLDHIDAKILALETMGQVARTVGSDAKTMAENFQSVQNQLNDLYAQVEVGMRLEEEQWQDSGLTDQTTVDRVLLEMQPPDTTLAQIDAVLSH